MCTVTIFYKGNNDFVLTSNRDEAPNRIANSPGFYNINNTEILMPKDEQSGGSWIGVSEKNRIVCLLNGGFVIHKRKNKYRQSRGVVVKDVLTMKSLDAIKGYDFNNIEPFTIVIADWNDNMKFVELVWTGEKVSFKELPLTSHIWSSSTLYTEEKKEARRHWFKDFKLGNNLTSKTLLEFHKTAGRGNLDYGVVMDRNHVKTTSITQVHKFGGSVEMNFYNLNTFENSVKFLNIPETINE